MYSRGLIYCIYSYICRTVYTDDTDPVLLSELYIKMQFQPYKQHILSALLRPTCYLLLLFREVIGVFVIIIQNT